jgi:ABC-type transport system substrate-binding protein
MDDLLDRAAQEPSPEQRCHLYGQVQTLAVEEVVSIPLYETWMITAYDKRLEGVNIPPQGFYFEFYDTYWEK